MLLIGVLLFFLYIIEAMGAFHNIQTVTYDDENIDTFMIARGFLKIGQNYYNIMVDTQVNWFEAAHICRSLNAQLVAIEDEAEMDALNKYLTRLYSQGFFWTAGNSLSNPSASAFSWLSTGKAITYSNWSPGQPDRRAGDEYCMHLWIVDGRFQWNDNYCNSLAHFICEADRVSVIKFVVF